MAPTATEPRGAYRMKSASAWLGISDDTLARLIQRGEIASYTVGRARFISAKELERFVSDREANAR
jgi:excisionase family DNA binding protein